MSAVDHALDVFLHVLSPAVGCALLLPAVGPLFSSITSFWTTIHHCILDLRLLCFIVDNPFSSTDLLASCHQDPSVRVHPVCMFAQSVIALRRRCLRVRHSPRERRIHTVFAVWCLSSSKACGGLCGCSARRREHLVAGASASKVCTAPFLGLCSARFPAIVHWAALVLRVHVAIRGDQSEYGYDRGLAFSMSGGACCSWSLVLFPCLCCSSKHVQRRVRSLLYSAAGLCGRSFAPELLTPSCSLQVVHTSSTRIQRRCLGVTACTWVTACFLIPVVPLASFPHTEKLHAAFHRVTLCLSPPCSCCKKMCHLFL